MIVANSIHFDVFKILLKIFLSLVKLNYYNRIILIIYPYFSPMLNCNVPKYRIIINHYNHYYIINVCTNLLVIDETT